MPTALENNKYTSANDQMKMAIPDKPVCALCETWILFEEFVNGSPIPSETFTREDKSSN
jgi:hypothetical protein